MTNYEIFALSHDLTNLLGEDIPEALISKLTDKQYSYIKHLYFRKEDQGGAKAKIREILLDAKKKVENANTVLRQDDTLQLKGDKKVKIFDFLINYTQLENQDNSLRQLIK
jgi:hypothetical protein